MTRRIAGGRDGPVTIFAGCLSGPATPDGVVRPVLALAARPFRFGSSWRTAPRGSTGTDRRCAAGRSARMAWYGRVLAHPVGADPVAGRSIAARNSGGTTHDAGESALETSDRSPQRRLLSAPSASTSSSRMMPGNQRGRSSSIPTPPW